ncbi:MAG: diaminopimelate decarboxylase [Candidatus Pelagibacter sp.]
MQYKNKNYYVEKISTNKLIKKYKTPLYCYSYKKLVENINFIKSKFKKLSPIICFSVKSNSNLSILKELKKLQLGADVVSQGELMKALNAGIDPKKIVFSGVGKTTSELSLAINKKILLINVESKNEILEIEKIAKSKKKAVDIGIRLNPNTDAKTLKQISTGKKENKFGVDERNFIELVNYSKNSKYLKLKCLSVHIGSQILDYKPYKKMLTVLSKLINKLNFNFEYVDLGGGMGISYQLDGKKLNYEKYSKEILEFKKKYGCKIIFEPGRSIIGNAGIIISKVIYLKETKSKCFVILDAAMNDLMRPALYGAKHQIIPVNKNSKRSQKIYEFVGPICESTDKFLTSSNFQRLKQNDYIIICDVGAYGYSLSSNYNSRPKPAEVMVKAKKINLIQKRQKLKDLI